MKKPQNTMLLEFRTMITSDGYWTRRWYKVSFGDSGNVLQLVRIRSVKINWAENLRFVTVTLYIIDQDKTTKNKTRFKCKSLLSYVNASFDTSIEIHSLGQHHKNPRRR